MKQLRDASLAWVLEIEGEVDEKVRRNEYQAASRDGDNARFGKIAQPAHVARCRPRFISLLLPRFDRTT